MYADSGNNNHLMLIDFTLLAQVTKPHINVASSYIRSRSWKKGGSAQTSAVFSLARTGNVARTHSVSWVRERWEDFQAVLKKRRQKLRRGDFVR
jgi:hypothetical protein